MHSGARVPDLADGGRISLRGRLLAITAPAENDPQPRLRPGLTKRPARPGSARARCDAASTPSPRQRAYFSTSPIKAAMTSQAHGGVGGCWRRRGCGSRFRTRRGFRAVLLSNRHLPQTVLPARGSGRDIARKAYRHPRFLANCADAAIIPCGDDIPVKRKVSQKPSRMIPYHA